MSATEKAVFTKTLLCFLQSLEGSVIAVDLRRESCVTGRLTSVDGAMNLHMAEVTVKAPGGAETTFSETFIKGKNVRFVRFAEDVEPRAAIEGQLAKYRRMDKYNDRERSGK